MNTKCAICLKLDLEARQRIDDALLNGLPYRDIQEFFPEISHITLSRHKRHMGKEQNEVDVSAQRLVREHAQLLMNTYNPSEFIVSVRERLEGIINDSLTIAEDFTAQVLDKKNVQYYERLRKDAIVSLKNSISSLESVSGLKQLIDLNAVYNTITTHGYEVNTPDLPDTSTQPLLKQNLN